MKLKLLLISALFAVALSACAGLDAADNDSPSSSPSSSNNTPVATQTPVSNEDATSDRCGGSLEGCFSYYEMDEYLDAVIPMVAQYFEEHYPRVSAPRDIVYIPSGRAAQTVCGTSNSYSYEYCPANRSIYIGQDLLWQFYAGAGDAAPAIGLAHEWGHHLQTMLGVQAVSRTQAIKFENQADCVSGAWAKYADEQGWLEADDDLRDATKLLDAIGSAEGPGRDHGTSAERESAFNTAYSKGIAACNAFFPDSPIA
jgi:predicted metalloprotease